MTFHRQLFASALMAHVTRHKLSLRDAAKQSGVSASTLSRIASGEAPDIDTFAALVRWLGADSNVFLDGSPSAAGADAWTRLYEALSDLNIPEKDLIVNIINLIYDTKHLD